MKGRSSRWLMILAVAFVATSVNARSRAGASPAPEFEYPAVMSLGGADVPFEYQNWYSNGIVELAFDAPAWMSPIRGEYDRPALLIATLFVADNAAVLGIRQDPSAFKVIGNIGGCDGATRVTFQQTYASLPIESTRVEVSVRGQLVSHVSARLVPDVAKLPVCQPTVAGNQRMTELYYRPETDRTIVIVVVIDEVAGPKLERLRDACTGIDIGYKLLLD